MVRHSFKSPRRRLGEHKAWQGDAIWLLKKFKAAVWFRDKKGNEKIKGRGQGTKKAQPSRQPIKPLPNYRELLCSATGASSSSRCCSSNLQVPLLLPNPDLHVHSWTRLLPDLPFVSSLLLPPPSRSPLSFLTAAAAPLLDPHARFPCCCTSRARTEGDGSRNGSLALPDPPPVLPLSLLPPLLSHFADFGHGVQDAQGFSSAWTPRRRLKNHDRD